MAYFVRCHNSSQEEILNYPRIGHEDRAEAVLPVHSGGSLRALGVKTKVDRWREENPDALRTWKTTNGCVVQFGGMRIYYGTCPNVLDHDAACLVPHGGRKESCKCQPCGGLVTTRRSVQGERHREGMTQLGRWPVYCPECRQRNQAASYTKNRKYAANYRRGMYERRGFGPRQGIPGVMATMARMEQETEAEEHWSLYHSPIYGDDANECYDPDCRYNKAYRGGQNRNA
ncbi:hypothetical protein [Mycolicibacterium sp. XJ1904]